jgi:hypothetical protein
MARRKARRNPNKMRTASLIGGGIGIALGLIGAQNGTLNATGVVTLAAAGLVAGALVGGARTGDDFHRALLEGR